MRDSIGTDVSGMCNLIMMSSGRACVKCIVHELALRLVERPTLGGERSSSQKTPAYGRCDIDIELGTRYRQSQGGKYYIDENFCLPWPTVAEMQYEAGMAAL